MSLDMQTTLLDVQTMSLEMPYSGMPYPGMPFTALARETSGEFSEEAKSELQSRKNRMATIALIPIFGQFFIWFNDFLLDQEIQAHECIHHKIELRKLSIGILEHGECMSAIYSIALAILWGLLTNAETRSAIDVFKEMGKSFTVIYTVMTAPSRLLIHMNGYQLAAERKQRDEEEIANKSGESDTENSDQLYNTSSPENNTTGRHTPLSIIPGIITLQ